MKYKPMLATIGDTDLLKDEDLFFEPKLDGYRAICEVSAKGMTFYSRRGTDITKQFPEFDFRDAIDAKTCILDGEIIIYNKKGLPDYHLMQGRTQLENKQEIEKRADNHPATYAVFDILSKNGTSLIKKPFLKRRDILHETVDEADNLELVPGTHDGTTLFNKMKKHGLEGVIAKKPHAQYHPGKRRSVWQKVKFNKTLECVVLGYTQEKRRISSLALGLYNNEGNLTYVGRVGTGFSQEKIDLLYPKLKKLEIGSPPIDNAPSVKHITWVKPQIVVEVKYLEMCSSGSLRHTAYLHMRDDKKPKSCTFDQIS